MNGCMLRQRRDREGDKLKRTARSLCVNSFGLFEVGATVMCAMRTCEGRGAMERERE